MDLVVSADVEAGVVCLRVHGATEWSFGTSATRRSDLLTACKKRPPDPALLPRELRNGFEYTGSPDGVDANLLVMLHGFGDGPGPFSALGRKFSLPQTAVLALRGPVALPLDLGHGWFEAIDLVSGDLISPASREKRRVASLASTLRLLDALLLALAHQRGGGWGDPQRIFLFGFSQGGTVALEWALARGACRTGSGGGSKEIGKPFGGVVAVAAGLMEERRWPDLWPPPEQQVKKWPHGGGRCSACLIVSGLQDAIVPVWWVDRSAAEISRAADMHAGPEPHAASPNDNHNGDESGVREGVSGRNGGSGELFRGARVAWFEKGHGMLASAGEARAVMEFLAPRLHRSSAWEQDPDVIEVAPGEASLTRV